MSQIYQYLPKNLRNIFVCKYLRILRKLNYPYCILPITKYKINIDCDTLINNQNIYILRRSNLSNEETFQSVFGQIVLNDDAIDDIRIANLSVNLLGGTFKNKHCKYLSKGQGASNWQGDDVYLSDFINDYKVENNKGLIFIKASYLHNIEFPYNLPSDPHLHKEAAKFQNTVGETRVLLNTPKHPIQVIGKTYFVHSPINLNYWHLELKVENYMEVLLENPKKNSDKRFLEQLFTNLIKLNSEPTFNSFDKINEAYYSA
jgi:hypothetical protein